MTSSKQIWIFRRVNQYPTNLMQDIPYPPPISSPKHSDSMHIIKDIFSDIGREVAKSKNRYMTRIGTKISWGGKKGIKMCRGLRTQGSSNNPLLFRMDWLMLVSWKYLRSKMGGWGNCIHNMVHSDTYWRRNTGGSVLKTDVQAVAQVRVQKDISGCQSWFLSYSGGFFEQSKISRLLTVTWESNVYEIIISIIFGSFYLHLDWNIMEWLVLRNPPDHQKWESSRVEAICAK